MIPRLLLGNIDLIIKWVRKAWSWLNKSSEDVGKIEPVTIRSTIEDVVEINEILAGFREYVEKECTEIENQIIIEISDYADELCFLAEKSNPILFKYKINMKKFKRQIDKLKTGISGTMQKEISRKLSLGNPECKRVVTMLAGNKKQEEFKLLLAVVIEAGITAIIEKTELIIDNINDEFEIMLNDCLELIEKQYNSQMQALTNDKNESNSLIKTKELLKNKANLVICSTNLVENILGREG